MTTTKAPATAAQPPASVCPTLVQPHLQTNEFRLAYETGAFAVYCRMPCSLCHTFVSRLKTPVEFRSLKAFFPFIRLASVLEFPRTQANLPLWLQLAFQAGRELGDAHPEAADEILPDHVLHKTRASLTAFQTLLGHHSPEAGELAGAFAELAARQWPQVEPSELDQVYCETAIRALRAGYMAATLAQTDPGLASFCDELPRATADDADLVQQALRNACTFEWDATLVHRMEHPLFRLARQCHRNDPSAQDSLLAEANAALHAAAVQGENEDPVSLLTSGDSDAGEAAASFRGRQLANLIRRLDQRLTEQNEFAEHPTATSQ